MLLIFLDLTLLLSTVPGLASPEPGFTPECLVRWGEHECAALQEDLARAVRLGKLDAARAALEAGADPNGLVPNELRPLSSAMLFDHPELAVMLLDHGADPGDSDDGTSRPLALALAKGYSEIALRIVEAGVPLDRVDEEGDTVLTDAALSGNLDLLARIHARLGDGAYDAAVRAALWARNYGKEEALAYFRSKGIEPPADGVGLLADGLPFVPRDLAEAFETIDLLLPEQERTAYREDNDGPVLAHFGLGLWIRNEWGLWGGSRLAQFFWRMGVTHPDDMSGVILESYQRRLRGEALGIEEQMRANEEFADQLGAGPDALVQAIEDEDHALVKRLLDDGADVHRRYWLADGSNTLLHIAAARGADRIVEILLAAGADPDAGNSGSETALMLAAKGGHRRTVRHLLRAGADPARAANWRDTALVYAARERHPEIVRDLLKLPRVRSDPDLLDAGLRAAAEGGVPEILRGLIRAGADVEARDPFWGWSPLDEAAIEGNLEAVRLLVHAGADPNARNEDGKSALDVARGADTRRYLREAGAANAN